MEGNIFNVGRLTDCSEYRHEVNGNSTNSIEGQYCLAVVSASQTSSVKKSKFGAFDWREM